MASDPITPGNKETEEALRNLSPSPLDDGFLDRLEAAADGSLATLSDAEIRFEQSLRGFNPVALSDDFLGRLERSVSDLPFPANEKIVLFPKTAPVHRKARSPRTPWAAAAAVALIGGFSALMIPQSEPAKPGQIVKQAPAPSQDVRTLPYGTQAVPYSGNIAPASTNAGADVQDMGVSWHESGQPHRVLRLTYRGKVTVKNPDGTITEVEQPQPEYIFIPEKVD